MRKNFAEKQLILAHSITATNYWKAFHKKVQLSVLLIMVSRTIELSLQSSFQLSLMVLVRY